MPDFAKVLRLSDGTQALVYIEPAGDDQVLHQVLSFDDFQIDVKIEGLSFSVEQQSEFLADVTEQQMENLKNIVLMNFVGD